MSVTLQSPQQALQPPTARPINLGRPDNIIETDAQVQAQGGPPGAHRGQEVVPLQGFNAAEMVENLAEAGLTSTLARLSGGRPTPRTAQTVRARPSAAEEGDAGSATAEDTPEAIARRIGAFVGISGEGGGAGGGQGDRGSQQGQQQHRQAAIAGIRASSDKKAQTLAERLDALARRPSPDGEGDRDAIRRALSDFSDDAVQQLLALEAVRAGGAYDNAFGEALEAVQREFEGLVDGGHMVLAIRDAYAALHLEQAARNARATMATDPAGVRTGVLRQLGDADPAALAEELTGVLGRLREAGPDTFLRNGGLRDILGSYLQAAGHEMADHEGPTMSGDRLRDLLGQLSGLKLLNSAYDLSDELIRNSNLRENDRFNAAAVMSFALGFVSNPRPDASEAIPQLDALLAADVLTVAPGARVATPVDLEARILFSTNFDTMHREFPRALLPGRDDKAQDGAWRAQNDIIVAWRSDLARAEDEALESWAPARQTSARASAARAGAQLSSAA